MGFSIPANAVNVCTEEGAILHSTARRLGIRKCKPKEKVLLPRHFELFNYPEKEKVRKTKRSVLGDIYNSTQNQNSKPNKRQVSK